MESALSSKGQITIPKIARDRLNIGPGDRVKFFFDAEGHLTILPKIRASALRGVGKSPFDRAVTIEEMEEGSERGAVEDATGR